MGQWKNKKAHSEHSRRLALIHGFKKGDPQSIKAAKKGMKNRLLKTPNTQSLAGKNSRKFENRKANEIKNEFDQFYQPNEVCDRIAVKDGKLVFIEIKNPKYPRLRKKQKKFKELCNKLNIEYRIVT